MRREKQKLKLLPWKVWEIWKGFTRNKTHQPTKGSHVAAMRATPPWSNQCGSRTPSTPTKKKKKNSYSFYHPKYGRPRNRGAADDPDYTFVYRTKQWRGWSWRPSNQWRSSGQNRLVGPQSLMRRYKAMMNLYTVGEITHHQCSMKTLLIRE